jgi:cell division septation protein DedD
LSRRYFEIVITARQLVLLIGAVIVLLLVAFGLGVGVGWQEPVIVTGGPAGPTPLPTAPFFAAAEPIPVPTSAPTPAAALPRAEPPARATATPAPPRTARPGPAAVVTGVRWVQVAVVSQAASASDLRNRLVSLGYRGDQVVIEEIGGRFRVRLGPFPDDESARRVAGRLGASGFSGTFVVHE